MTGFKELEGDTVIIKEGGVFKQVPLYERHGQLYAAAKGGFIRLNADGSTSTKAQFTELIYEGDLYRDQFNRLCTAPSKTRKLIHERRGPIALGYQGDE